MIKFTYFQFHSSINRLLHCSSCKCWSYSWCCIHAQLLYRLIFRGNVNIDVYYSYRHLQITNHMCNTQRGFLFCFVLSCFFPPRITKYFHMTIFLLSFQHITPAQWYYGLFVHVLYFTLLVLTMFNNSNILYVAALFQNNASSLVIITLFHTLQTLNVIGWALACVFAYSRHTFNLCISFSFTDSFCKFHCSASRWQHLTSVFMS